MIWTTWRQHRMEALAALVVLVGVAALVRVADVSHEYQRDGALLPSVQLALAVLPGLVGVFIGAPLLARDLEQGTHRLLWTQGVPRARWLARKLLLVLPVVIVAAALLGVYAGLTQDAQVVLGSDGTVHDAQSRWMWFELRAPAFAAYALFCLALGIAAGAVIGRTYPAMALTTAGFIAVRVAVLFWVRPRYLAPLREPLTSLNILPLRDGPHEAWFVGTEYRDAAGHELSIDQVLSRLSGPAPSADSLTAHGISGWAYYQPADRFWLFQGIESALLVALAALLIVLTVYWVTRRAA